MEAVKRKRGETIKSDGRKVIWRTLSACEEEKERKGLLISITEPILRTAYYSGVSVRTVQRIKKEGGRSVSPKMKTPGKKRKREKTADIAGDYDRLTVSRIIQTVYVHDKTVPTIRTLLLALRASAGFVYGKDTLRKILLEMGYQWKTCGTRRKILMEKPDIVNRRAHYIKEIRELRAEKRPIFYVDETWVDTSLSFQKSWRSEKAMQLTDASSKNTLIIAHCISEMGFLKGAQLIFKAGTTNGDYCGNMDQQNFEKWAVERLFPNLPENAVIVIDNVPYHTVPIEKVPKVSSTKLEMMKWLRQRNVPYTETMRKYELLALIEQNKRTSGKQYQFDELAVSLGYTVIRLPPYCCELNMMEAAWSKVKKYVKEESIIGDIRIEELRALTEQAFGSITETHVQEFLNHIIKTEDLYWEMDPLYESVIDDIILCLRKDGEDELDFDGICTSSSSESGSSRNEVNSSSSSDSD